MHAQKEESKRKRYADVRGVVLMMRRKSETNNTGRTKKFRIGIAALAGVMTMSVGAPFAVSAQTFQPDTSGAFIFDQYETQEDESNKANPRAPYVQAALAKAADQAIKHFLKDVPWSAAYTVALNKLFGQLLEGILGEAIPELTEQIVSLQKEMKKQVEDLKELIGKNSELQDYRNALTSMETTMDILTRQVKLGKADGATDQDEMVRIADKLGSSKEWSTDGLIYKLTLTGKYLKGDNYTSKSDLFQLVTEMNAKKSMFSGEAINLSSEYLSRAIGSYLCGTALALRMLTVQRQVASFTEEDIAKLNPVMNKVRKNLRLDVREIDQQIEELLKDVVGDREAEKASDRDGVLKRYSDFISADRHIFINKGTTAKRLSSRLQVLTNQQIVDAAKSRQGKAQAGFNPDLNIHDAIADIGALTRDEKIAMIDHIRNQYSNLTVSEYLKKTGFDTSNLERPHISISTAPGFNHTARVSFRQIGYECYVGVRLNETDKINGECNIYYKKGGVSLVFWEIGKEEGVVDGALAYFAAR